ncbi:MAG: hypothetical protein B7Y80_06630 [Hyphomicrobium sp. 32-62-53]|nr:MAG: hypothetical protein B7Z29_04890 [Hyphomicrobium sp. 12-62-95]OYY00301.1 MAG: hypothetical protein B7Y80_06630 [Hyphomicrobium sp. 32-62-53]
MTIKKTLIGAASVAALAFAASAVPAAAEDREFAWSITLGATSDYIFRGLSLSNEDPAAQGSIDMSYGIFYAGAWASNIDNGAYEPWELDLYAGVKPVLGPVTFDFGAVAYLYPADSADLDYVELKAGASMEIVKSLTGGVTFWYQPDQSNAPEVISIEGSLAYALPQVGIFSPTISGLIGYSEDTDSQGWFAVAPGANDAYTYWNVGLAVAVEKFTMDFRYWDTDYDQIPGDFYTGLSDERFVFSAKVTLP